MNNFNQWRRRTIHEHLRDRDRAQLAQQVRDKGLKPYREPPGTSPGYFSKAEIEEYLAFKRREQENREMEEAIERDDREEGGACIICQFKHDSPDDPKCYPCRCTEGYHYRCLVQFIRHPDNVLIRECSVCRQPFCDRRIRIVPRNSLMQYIQHRRPPVDVTKLAALSIPFLYAIHKYRILPDWLPDTIDGPPVLLPAAVLGLVGGVLFRDLREYYQEYRQWRQQSDPKVSVPLIEFRDYNGQTGRYETGSVFIYDPIPYIQREEGRKMVAAIRELIDQRYPDTTNLTIEEQMDFNELRDSLIHWVMFLQTHRQCYPDLGP